MWGCRLRRVTSRRLYWMGSLPYAVDGAAPWLVNVDGAGPTDRRGAVRVPCESLVVRLSSLGSTAPSDDRRALRNPNEKPTDSLTKSTHYSPVGLYIDAQARFS